MLNSYWIINKKQDLLWLIGSVFISYIVLSIYYILYYFAGVSIAVSSLVVYLIWSIMFDATHLFATYTRTYFDKDFYQKNTRLIYGGLVLLFVGPIYMTLFYMIGTQEQYRAAFIIFNRFGLLYAYYHFIRQHWGFIVLYNRKTGACPSSQGYLESIILWSGTLCPLIYHHIYYYNPFGLAEKMLTSITFQDWNFVGKVLLIVSVILWTLKTIIKLNFLKSVLSTISYIFLISAFVLFFGIYFGVNQVLKTLLVLFAFTFITALTTYMWYLFYKKNEIKVSVPKILLLFFVVFTNNFILTLDIPLIVALSCITIFHNVQYHAIVRFHNVNKYSYDENKFGLASTLTKNVPLLISITLSFSLILAFPRTAIDFVNVHESFVYFVVSFLWGIGFHHYVFDAIIWRPSRDTEVANSLKLQVTQ